MKKTLLIVLVIAALVLAGCSISTRNAWKNFKADYGNGLEREVSVYNAVNGEKLWHYKGYCYIKDDSSPGDVTIIWDTDRIAKKTDFIGHHVIVEATEI